MHQEPFKYKGKQVPLRKDFCHNQYPDMDHIIVEDWWDRLAGQSWLNMQQNPAVIIYAIRARQSKYSIPIDDDVLYGKYKGMGVLVHVSELNLNDLDTDDSKGSTKETDRPRTQDA